MIMDKENWPVHERHCCPKHGCKYGDKDCPVVNRLTEKHNEHCEDCENEAKYPHEFVTPVEYQKGQAAIEALELLEKSLDKREKELEAFVELEEKSYSKNTEHWRTLNQRWYELDSVFELLEKLRTPDGRERIRKELEG